MDRSRRVRARCQGPGSPVAGGAARLHVTAVGFDFDHTLGIDNKLERVAFLRLLEPRAALIDEIELIDDLLARQRAGAFSIEQAVTQFVIARGVADPSGYPDRYKQMCVEMVDSYVIAEPGARALCGQLRERGVPHAILTNGWSALQKRKAAIAGFTGPVLVSADLGAQKPSLRAFGELIEALGSDAASTAYVGDTPESDVAGAIEAGMIAVWYDAERKPYPTGLPAPHATIHSLSEIAGLLAPG